MDHDIEEIMAESDSAGTQRNNDLLHIDRSLNDRSSDILSRRYGEGERAA